MKRFCLICIMALSGLAFLASARPGQAQPVCPPGYIFVPGSGCQPSPPPPPVPPVHDPNLKQVARRFTYVHTCPGETCPMVTTLSRGTPVHIINWAGPYVQVRVPGSRIEGWVKLRHLTP